MLLSLEGRCSLVHGLFSRMVSGVMHGWTPKFRGPLIPADKYHMYLNFLD